MKCDSVLLSRAAVQNAFNMFNKICREKVKKEELPDVIKELGIALSEEELQVALASAAVDGKVFIHSFTDSFI